MARRESMGRIHARTQSASGPPVQQMVEVAVLPPALPPGVAPSQGQGVADAFSWDESINWQHNTPVKEGQDERKKGFLKRIGLTTERKKQNPDLPVFTMRQVSYDTWRKHYAKDKDGNYRGTRAPAEDCLLKPDDVKKWNLGEGNAYADKFTRGKQILPVYSEVKEHEMVPEYEVDYDGPPRDGGPLINEPVVTVDEDELATHLEKKVSAAQERRAQVAAFQEYEQHQQKRQQQQQQQQQQQAGGQGSSSGPRPSDFSADGKTAEEIIAEARANPPKKPSWKTLLKTGGGPASFSPPPVSSP